MKFTTHHLSLEDLQNQSGHIFVTGIPGSGKTTFAGKLVNATQLDFIRLDELDGATTSESVFELIEPYAKSGEQYIVEGWQTLLYPEDKLVENHTVVIIQIDRETAIQRLVDRGWIDSNGKWKQGDEYINEAADVIDWVSEKQNEFIKQFGKENITFVNQNNMEKMAKKIARETHG